MKLLSTLTALFLLFAAAPSKALLTSELTIDYISGAKDITVYFNEAFEYPAKCFQGGLKAVTWKSEDEGAKNLMAMILSAKLSNRSVRLGIDDNNCNFGAWPKLLQVQIL